MRTTRARSAAASVRTALSTRDRMLPGFMIAGTKRGGSSSLYQWICAHPAVTPSRTVKGTRYFDVNYPRGWAWFRSRFDTAQPGPRLTGDASPYCMFHPLAPARLAEALPGIKIIIALREPVERAFSHHQYETARGYEELTFEQAVDAEAHRLAGEEDRMRADPSYESYSHRHHAYLRRGHYADQLEGIHRLFGPEQVLVLQSEALFSDPQAQLELVWSFLQIPRVRLADLRPVKANPHGPVPPAIAARLSPYYRTLNERLYQLPGVGFRWADPHCGEGTPA